MTTSSLSDTVDARSIVSSLMVDSESEPNAHPYAFGRDMQETYRWAHHISFVVAETHHRLNYGHFHHTAILGYLIHPSITLPDISEDTYRIADLGGGTG